MITSGTILSYDHVNQIIRLKLNLLFSLICGVQSKTNFSIFLNVVLSISLLIETPFARNN